MSHSVIDVGVEEGKSFPLGAACRADGVNLLTSDTGIPDLAATMTVECFVPNIPYWETVRVAAEATSAASAAIDFRAP